MRYPLWAFLVIFLVPPFALHATLVGKAGFVTAPTVQVEVRATQGSGFTVTSTRIASFSGPN